MGKDNMIRVPPQIYEIIRLASIQYKKDIRSIASEALNKWIQDNVSKEDKKLFDQMINRRHGI
jgi:hypothetical protein